MRVTNSRGLENTLIGTGFPFKHPQHLDSYLATFKAIHPKVSGIRRAGSAALDLAYVAAGRLDGFWEIGLNSWDIAAGVLLIKESGGFIGDFSGRDMYFETGNVVAGNTDVFKELLKTIHPHLTEELQK
jgi:myo-inositol-1(or 4)-monophosphatase